MKFPKKLKKGDTVGLVCTSSQISEERISQCVDAMQELGYKVKIADNLAANYAGFMAGKGEKRAEWVNKMFADPEVDAIFCVRGGDGSSRIMEFLDVETIKSNPKIFVGFSDVTNMHLFLTQECDMVSFHGPMVSSNIVGEFNEESKKSLYASLEADGEYEFENGEGFEIGVLKEGKAEGVLIGGNLSLLSASIGTPYEVDTKDKIIFIEEVGEDISKVEKWTYHLRNAGKFKDCRGVILGQFTNIVCKEMPEYDELCVYKDALEGLDIPVLYNIQAGHGDPNMTLPMGALCKIDTSDRTVKFVAER